MNILKKISSLLLSIALIITGINVNTMTLNTVKAASTQKEVYPNFLKTEGKEIKNTNGNTVYLRCRRVYATGNMAMCHKRSNK